MERLCFKGSCLMTAAVLLFLVPGVGPAAEATLGGERAYVVWPMRIKTFVPDVAQANGYEVVRLPDGRTCFGASLSDGRHDSGGSQRRGR
jgi:hypothetical protein